MVTPGFAEWTFDSFNHGPASAGQPLKIVVQLKGEGGQSVHVSASVDQNTSFQEVGETREISPGVRQTEFTVPIGADATGFWHFVFQVVEDGIGKQRKEFWVQINDVPTASAPATQPVMTATTQPVVAITPAPASAPAIAAPPVFGVVPPAVTPVATPSTMPVVSPEPATAATSPALPAIDLAVEFVDAPAEITGAPGEIRLMHYKVQNKGAVTAPSVIIRYGSNLQGGFDRYSEPLHPGGEIAGTVQFEIDPDITEFWVDASSRGMQDADTSNNRDQRPLRLGPPSPYEISVSNFSLVTPTTSLQSGEPLEVRFMLTNAGPASVDKPLVVALDGFEGGTLFQTVNPTIAPTASQYVRFRGWLPQGQTPILKASADVTNVLQERNEADNFATLDLSQQPAPAEPASTPLATTPTPPALSASPDEQDVKMLGLKVSPRRPRPGEKVLFVIAMNRRTVVDRQGVEHEVEKFLWLDPRGDRMGRIPFLYNSSVNDPKGGTVHLFAATFAYNQSDAKLERHARISYSPPREVPDLDQSNNAATGIVQVEN